MREERKKPQQHKLPHTQPQQNIPQPREGEKPLDKSPYQHPKHHKDGSNF